MNALHKARLVNSIDCLRHDITRVDRLIKEATTTADRMYWRHVLLEKWDAIDCLHGELDAIDELSLMYA